MASTVPASHARTAMMVGDLYSGFQLFLDYATDTGALSEAEARRYADRAWDALLAVAFAQTTAQREANPVERFLALLGTIVAARRVRLAKVGDPFEEDNARPDPHIGWIDGGDVYLLDAVAFAEVRRFATEQGQPLPGSLRSLRRGLDKAGLLRSTGKDHGRESYPIQKVLGGARCSVLHLPAYAFLSSEPEQCDQPERNRDAASPATTSALRFT